jgi:hypothetical protein
MGKDEKDKKIEREPLRDRRREDAIIEKMERPAPWPDPPPPRPKKQDEE